MTTIQKVFWLASYPKSGNTWIRLLLQACKYGTVDINRMTITLQDINEHSHQLVSSLPITTIDVDVGVAYRHAALMNMIITANRTPILFKTHNKNLCLNGIELMPLYLTTAAVYIIRDPRDVVISLSEHIGSSVDETIRLMSDDGFRIGADKEKRTGLVHFLGSWSTNVSSWTDEDRYPVTVIRYEDLINDTENELMRIIDGMKLKVKKPRIKKAVNLCAFEKLSKEEKRNGFGESSTKTESFFTRGTSGHWKDILSSDQARRIENDHREVMEQYGYLETNISEIRSCQI